MKPYERLIKYVQVYTTSDEHSGMTPSASREFDLAHILVEEMKEIGILDAVKNGGNRQDLHEKIRTLSMEAGKTVKVEGKENNLLELIAADDEFPMELEELEATMQPEKYVGRSPRQVEKYLEEVIQPILDANKELLGVTAEINV